MLTEGGNNHFQLRKNADFDGLRKDIVQKMTRCVAQGGESRIDHGFLNF